MLQPGRIGVFGVYICECIRCLIKPRNPLIPLRCGSNDAGRTVRNHPQAVLLRTDRLRRVSSGRTFLRACLQMLSRMSPATHTTPLYIQASFLQPRMRARLKHVWTLTGGLTFTLLYIALSRIQPPSALHSALGIPYGFVWSLGPSTDKVDLEQILSGRLQSETANGTTKLKWTDHDGIDDAPFEQAGIFPGHNLSFDNDDIVDARTQRPTNYRQDGHPFNLAVLRLPRGSKWQFVGVSRGPTVYHQAVWVSGQMSREQTLIA